MAEFDPAKDLKELKPEKDFFVGIDSDGCAFDTMGIKQRKCFSPAMIECFGLEPVAQAAHECKEFADLFSKTRGANRHKTMVRILTELLPSHPMVKEKKFPVPQYEHYFAWANDPNSLLSNDGLKQAIEKAKDPVAKEQLELALKWSLRVNELVTEIVNNEPAGTCFGNAVNCSRMYRSKMILMIILNRHSHYSVVFPDPNVFVKWKVRDSHLKFPCLTGYYLVFLTTLGGLYIIKSQSIFHVLLAKSGIKGCL